MFKHRHQPDYVIGQFTRSSDDRDRRETVRYEPRDTRCLVGWVESGAFRPVRGRLRNFSQGGALIEIEEPPHRREPIWVLLGDRDGAGWIEGRAVDVQSARCGLLRSRRYALRIRFNTCCDWETFKSSLFGMNWRDSQPGDSGDDHDNGVRWR